jgi:hypothetical protein
MDEVTMIAKHESDDGAIDGEIEVDTEETDATSAPLPDELVSLKELARQIGMDRSSMLRYIKRLGYRPHKRRTADSGGQVAAAVRRDEADAILDRRKREGFVIGADASRTVSEEGYFYAVQLIPELSAKRVKLGFATNTAERLQQHRTAAPTAILIKSWPCRRTWEVAAMDSMTREGCELILNEVFDCEDLPALIERGDSFFSLMPDPTRRPTCSPISPLRNEGCGLAIND